MGLVRSLIRATVCSVAVSVALVTSIGVFAQTKVVVIPLGGDDAPSFRIVSNTDATGAPTQADFGRLEFTADSNPTPDSDWGTVCDDFLEGNSNANNVQRLNTLANLACEDMGYLGGAGILSANSGGPTIPGTLPTLLDNVNCPVGATSIGQCATQPEDCSNGEDIGVRCHLASESFLLNDVFSGLGACQFGGSASATVSHNLDYIDNPAQQDFDPGINHGTPEGDEIEIEFILEATDVNQFIYIAQAPGNTNPSLRFASVPYNCSDLSVEASFNYTDKQGHRWLVNPSVITGGNNGFTLISVVQFTRIP